MCTNLQTIIRIAGITNESVVDGPGLRCTVFFQGCPHHCPGCHNPETWDPMAGESLMLEELVSRMKLNPLISGVTFSGGEPLSQLEAALNLGQYIRNQGYSLWIYTGYTWEKLQKADSPGIQALLEITDVLVDGPYKMDCKDLGLAFRGSSNQRVIDVPSSLKKGQVLLWGG